ncbi:MAG TPA: hypothetical protein VG456_20720 [Candidatus Sulfopaludibacter sp.]|jgi:hypothetical protein|nr:hypothetical protein [Candidatus Sulfopaludibacter sp.]
MIRNVVTITGIMTLAASSALADFSYQEKSTITGGAMAAMLKVAGVFSKQAREPIQANVSVKGDRMVSRSASHASIIDLNAETITSVDLQKKTYSVMTFAQMKQMLEQAQAKMQNSKKDGDTTQMKFKVSASNPGNTKQVNGYDAKEMILKMQMEGTDEKSGQKGSMVITTDMWITPAVPGYAEVREFHKRMAEKLNWTPNGNMFMQRPDVAEGMAEVYKEIGKLDGMPVMQNVVMAAEGDPNQPQGQQQQAKPQQQQQSEGRPSLGGLLAGRLAKKKEKDDQAANSNPNSTPGSLLEMTTEMSAFSTAPVEDSQFTVPAGFKKVEQDSRRGQ